MRLLRTFTDKDLDSQYKLKSKINYIPRKAVRAVVFDDDKKVALLYVAKNHYHKLPGGGIEPTEEIKKALQRECLEEIGCHVSIEKEIGLIREYRDRFKQVQDSFCFLAKVKGPKGKPIFTPKEKRQGFKPVWVTEEAKGTGPLWIALETALEMLKNDRPLTYEGRFIQLRDLEFLKTAKKII